MRLRSRWTMAVLDVRLAWRSWRRRKSILDALFWSMEEDRSGQL